MTLQQKSYVKRTLRGKKSEEQKNEKKQNKTKKTQLPKEASESKCADFSMKINLMSYLKMKQKIKMKIASNIDVM